MKTKADWDNAPRLLEGLWHGRPGETYRVLRKFVNIARKAGRQDILLQCARQVSGTGYRLNDVTLVRHTLDSFQNMASESNFDPETTKKALAWSEQIFEMMELEEHIGKKGVKEGAVDPRVDARCVGILLGLAAARASRHLDGKDADGKVAKYAQRLSSTSLDFGKADAVESQNMWAVGTLPALYGMKTALKILDPASEVSQKLNVASKALHEEIDSALKEIRGLQLRSGEEPYSIRMYKFLFEES